MNATYRLLGPLSWGLSSTLKHQLPSLRGDVGGGGGVLGGPGSEEGESLPGRSVSEPTLRFLGTT